MTKPSPIVALKRQKTALARLIEAGRRAGMRDVDLIRAGIGADDLAESKKPKPRPGAPVWKPHQTPTIDAIVQTFVWQANADGLLLDMVDMTGSERGNGARKMTVAGPRMVAMWAVRTILGNAAGYELMGRFFGGRNHATIMHAVSIGAQKYMALNPNLAAIADKVRAKFQGDLLK